MIGPGDAARRALGAIDLASYSAGRRSTDALRLPSFLGIGAQKAGTTWLHANLSRHPELHLPEAKELHHFDWFRQRTLRRYAACFADAGDRLLGEVTPGYSALRGRRVTAVAAVLPPQARILVLLRDPVERAWSQLRMDVRQGGRNIDDVDDDELLRRLRSRGMRRRGDYVGMLADWERAFPGRVWIGFYEDLTDRPEELLAEIFGFLGVTSDVDWAAFPLRTSFNPGGGHAIRRSLHAELAALYRDDVEVLARRFGERVSRWALR